MRVLLIGGGGREHALAWKIAQSPLLSKLFLVGGSDRMSGLGTRIDIPLDEVPETAVRESVDLVVVGPEAPLVNGIADELTSRGIATFGPGAAGARLEASKAFTKSICARAGIPVAQSSEHTDRDTAKAALETMTPPYVVKADGLAAGKGVIIAEDKAAAHEAIDRMFDGAFGEAGRTVLIEEFLDGREISAFALTDGAHVTFFGLAEDYKRAFDGDQGPNTGGMGGVAPSPLQTDALIEDVMARIFRPLVRQLRDDGIDYRGCLYAGLIQTAEGPRLIEINCRLGDPECQLLMRRLRSDVLPLLWGAATARLPQMAVDWSPEHAANVVIAADGYPGPYAKGDVISRLEQAEAVPGAFVFHAGTAIEGGVVRASGGRVLNVTATAADRAAALSRAYEAARAIDWPGGFFRQDIGAR